LRFIFRLDFGAQIGWGHLSRSIAISEALIATGHEVVIATQSRPDRHPKLKQLVSRKVLEVESISHDKTLRKNNTSSFPIGKLESLDAIETIKLVDRVKADVLVLDHYGLRSQWLREVRKRLPVCHISDYPTETEVDFILDYGFDATPDKHRRGTGSRTKLMLGSAFAPVGENYARFSEPPKGISNELNSVLVSLGGFGGGSLATRILQTLDILAPAAEVHFAGDPSNYSALSSDSQARKVTYAQEASLAPLFESAGLAIVGAGVTMYELVASGSLGLVVQTAKNQELALMSAIEKDFVLGIQNPTTEQLEQKIRETLLGRSTTQRLEWLKARSLVDHLGPTRLALKLGGQGSTQPELREVKVSDMPFLLRIANQSSSRLASPNSHQVEPKEHWEWSQGFFDGSKRGWVFGAGELPIGHCRLEREDSKFYLSYSIQEEFQGEGWGPKMLQALLDKPSFPVEVFARVKTNNAPSLKVLQNAGFVPLTSQGELLTLVRKV